MTDGNDLEGFRSLVTVPNVVLVLAGCFVLALFKLNASELASWLQAIGSVAAIWGAFKIGNRQIQQQIAQREHDQESRASAYLAVVKNAEANAGVLAEMAACIDSIQDFRATGGVMTFQMFESAYRALQQIPAHELGSHKLVVAYLGLSGAMGEINRRLTQTLSSSAFEAVEFSLLREDILTQHRLIEIHWRNFSGEADTTHLSLWQQL
jgi:hypothetical protein